MTTKEVAQICGVTEKTVRENAKTFGKVFENGKPTEWTEEELKKVQLVLMKNAQSNNANASEQVKEACTTVFQLGTLANVALTSGNIEAAEQFSKLLIQATTATAQAKQLEEQNKLLLEQKEQAEANYLVEKQEHQKDKELVLHKYLTATQIKETIFKEYGKNIVVSKAVQRIPLDDNDILYKPFKNGDYTGQQPVYHPDVLDKIREILG